MFLKSECQQGRQQKKTTNTALRSLKDYLILLSNASSPTIPIVKNTQSIFCFYMKAAHSFKQYAQLHSILS